MSTSTTQSAHNIAEYTVSEISGALKKVVEERFNYVRVRGEISGLKIAASGHGYLSLKDEKSVLSGVCWKGTVSRLPFKPEDGLEVVATGKLTTYPGRSNYQIVIERMEPAGAGALMALLEKRKKELAAEGLFAPERKRPLPFLPQHIGVITSPTGAVIRDILHRLADRFPCQVTVWPVLVQGDGAAAQIAAAIEGFNALPPHLPVPELLIIARGGGSIEDLWPFNEEIVVRAVANSRIPTISAVGHETDTTLVDYASDRRAPTPTAAAEMAVPVLADLRYTLSDYGQRLNGTLQARFQHSQQRLEGMARGLPRPQELLARAEQDADRIAESLDAAMVRALERADSQLQQHAGRLLHPREKLAMMANQLSNWADRLHSGANRLFEQRNHQLQHVTARLRPANMLPMLTQHQSQLTRWHEALQRGVTAQITRVGEQLDSLTRQLGLLDYHKVLERGFALVRDGDGALVTSTTQAKNAASLTLTFKDGDFSAGSKPAKSPKKPTAKTRASADAQESLF